jgi:hypothetical protein
VRAGNFNSEEDMHEKQLLSLSEIMPLDARAPMPEPTPAPAAAPVAEAPTAAPPANAPVARFISGPVRTTTYKLVWAFEYDGRVYEEITIRRLSAKEVDDFIQEIRSGNTDARLPMFGVPDAVLDAMDADDSTALNEVAKPFMPVALRADSAPDSARSATSQDSAPGT